MKNSTPDQVTNQQKEKVEDESLTLEEESSWITSDSVLMEEEEKVEGCQDVDPTDGYMLHKQILNYFTDIENIMGSIDAIIKR